MKNFFGENKLKESELDIIFKKNNYFIKPGYISRTNINYFYDILEEETSIIHQPDVYTLAIFLGEKFSCTYIIDIGCGRSNKLIKLNSKFKIIGIDYGDNINFCKKNYQFEKWIKINLEEPKIIPINYKILRNNIEIENKNEKTL